MKRRGMALGLAALMTCTALFTTTANAKNKGSDEKETGHVIACIRIIVCFTIFLCL